MMGSRAHAHQLGKAARTSGDPPIPRRRPGRWITAIVVLVLASMLAHMLVTNDRLEWGVVWQYLWSEQILSGLLETLLLTVVCMAAGIVLGAIVALMRQSDNPILLGASWLYIWFFRSTPALVQLIFWYNLAALVPRISLGIPFGPSFVSADANSIFTPFVAVVAGLGLSEGGFMAEVIRGGILSVPQGQIEAASALGMTYLQTMRHIVFPQAIRVIVPPTGNQTIGMLKGTSLASVVSIAELLYSAELIYARTFQTIPLLVVVSIWYLVVTSAMSVGQHYLERHFGRGVGTSPTKRRPRAPRPGGDVPAVPNGSLPEPKTWLT